jgi:C-methyltransferase C-terminal domain/Putative zinc binding domain/Methyltransferase domain
VEEDEDVTACGRAHRPGGLLGPQGPRQVAGVPVPTTLRSVASLRPSDTVADRPGCRFCDAPLELTVIDLGMSPLCESFLRADELRRMEPFYPLHVFACESCFLVQLEALIPPDDIFTEYAYFSAYSSSWVEHARSYVEMIRERLSLGPDDLVVELASNDGYLLQHFVGTGVAILGVDPAANVAEAAAQRGVPTHVAFFGRDTATELVDEGRSATLVLGNNVLAQVPDLNDFVAGVTILLRADGAATFEFPHLLHLLEGLQYDTIYHEHFSYFSFATIVEIFRSHGLETFDVEELPTHGGSLRVYAQHADGPRPVEPAVGEMLAREEERGLRSPERYARFSDQVQESKRMLLELLIRLRREGGQVVGYGAPGKGNTLLNYCGIRTDLLEYTVDRNPYKHGLFTPGTHIPIFPPERIAATRPDYIVVLPWNLLPEISAQLEYVKEWGGKLVIPVPYAGVVEPGFAVPA